VLCVGVASVATPEDSMPWAGATPEESVLCVGVATADKPKDSLKTRASVGGITTASVDTPKDSLLFATT
jgi:hypothetical protein